MAIRPDRELIDDIDALLAALPQEIVDAIHALPDASALIEVVLDLGRRPEARLPESEITLLEREITEVDIAHVVDKIGTFGDDNRAGIERTLHRISAIRNRNGKIVGLTCRIGRAVYGTIDIINDFVQTGKSILIMGRPGIGKTTMLREAARVLADDLGKRVVVVDTSNEIAGDGDIPHPAIGKARRMQVRTPSLQHEVMIEAVENHMPQVIVIDEIGTELEAQAARTIAERGVQLIGTAHGNNLDNLLLNPTLSDLIGGIQSVTLGDEEARRRRSQKSVLERKQPPTFDVIVEIQDREKVLVHADVAATVDALLLGDPVAPEQRWKDEGGVHRSQSRPRPSPREQIGRERFAGLVGSGSAGFGGWGREPGWRGDSTYRTGSWDGDRGPGNGAGGLGGPGGAGGPGATRPGFRPGTSGGWRETRGGRESGGRNGQGGQGSGGGRLMPGERIARFDERAPDRGPSGSSAAPWSAAPAVRPDAPFVLGEIADRGPVERPAPGKAPAPASVDVRARDMREWERQQQWRDQAAQALRALKAEESIRAADAPDDEDADVDDPDFDLDLGDSDDEALADRARQAAITAADEGPALHVETGLLPTLRVFPFGISRKRLELAIRELQLPVIIARDMDEADYVMALRADYRQKGPVIREAEERSLPVYVLKANTILQMQASLTSIYSLQVDPREAALRETEEAIGLVVRESQAVELSPQNAYVRRLQHQMAERANLVSRSRGREPYRRVRLYPDEARPWR